MENASNTLLQKNKESTEAFALNIWNFIQNKQKQLSPSRICVYHHYSGTVRIRCDERNFITIRHFSNDESLLQVVASLAEQSDMKGKMFLHSSEGFLNVLDFKFSYE